MSDDFIVVVLLWLMRDLLRRKLLLLHEAIVADVHHFSMYLTEV
jgi:hypothetical protein